MADNYLPRNFRIISLKTRNKILHVEDALEIGKIRLDAYDFEKDNGARQNTHGFIDVHEARILFFTLRHGRIKRRFQAIGGSRPSSRRTPPGQEEPEGRVITVEEAEGTKNPIRITIENGPAIHDDQGLFQPAWWKDRSLQPARVTLLISRYDAIKIGLAGLEHLQAWATVTYWERLRAGTWHSDRAEDEQIDPLDIYRTADNQAVNSATGEFLA